MKKVMSAKEVTAFEQIPNVGIFSTKKEGFWQNRSSGRKMENVV